jgi:hypothetical protein
MLTFLRELWAQRVCLVLGLLRGRLDEGHVAVFDHDRATSTTRLRCLRCFRVREVRL